MFRHTAYLQFDVQPEKPDPVCARKLQELLGDVASGNLLADAPRGGS
jgi:Mn-containing catalase